MAKKIEVPFAMTEGDAGATQNSRERLINMYAEVSPSGNQLIRRQRPGLTRRLANTDEKRCIERHKSLHYVILGMTLYSFDGTSLTTLGNLSSSSGRCSMVFNDNDQILISDLERLYFWSGTTLSSYNLPEGTPGHVAYLGGYGIVTKQDSGVFYITGANDFSAIDALDFATAESSPDPLVRAFVDHNELWLAGTTTTEIWQLSGGADFPFSPYSNAQLERGCSAKLAYAAEDNTIFFLGDDKVVYRADGYRPVRVSQSAVEDRIADLSAANVAACSAFTYTWRGSKFLVLTFGEMLTEVYNISTGLWNTHETYGLDYWDVVGSNGGHTNYVMTSRGICLFAKVNTDEEGLMYRGGDSAPGNAGFNRRMTVNKFHLGAEVGRAAAGIEPEVMLRIAPDGETFGNEQLRSLGEAGALNRQVVWRNLGQGRKPVLRVGITDDVEFTITSADATVTVASS